jgi:hypothetical protein
VTQSCVQDRRTEQRERSVLTLCDHRILDRELGRPRIGAATSIGPINTFMCNSVPQLPLPIRLRAPFQVPELTCSAEINLNQQVSLPPRPHASTLTLPGDTPSSGTTHGQAAKRVVFSPLGGLFLPRSQIEDRYPPARGPSAEPAARSSSGRRLAPMDDHRAETFDSGPAGGWTSLEAAQRPPLDLQKVCRVRRPISRLIQSAILR